MRIQHVPRPCRKGGNLAVLRAVITGLFILAIPVSLIATNIRVAVSEQRVYDYSVKTYDAASRSGIPESELIQANGEIHHYLTAEDPPPLAINVTNSRGVSGSLFTAKETAHMADVRDLVQMAFTVQVISAAVVLTLATLLLVLGPPRLLAIAGLGGALLTGGVLALAGIAIASGFDSLWTEFHVLAFSNDFWALDPSRDHLIQMYPEAFWQEITALIVVATLLEASLMVGAASAYLILGGRQRRMPVLWPGLALAGRARHSRPKLPSPTPKHYFR
ncbi:MAG: TIGR01906 family membrane protein [Chloroflexi bacterium]|nr:MAG: TIGR01906 family membrane protein [Chloroflexota bacterium]